MVNVRVKCLPRSTELDMRTSEMEVGESGACVVMPTAPAPNLTFTTEGSGNADFTATFEVGPSFSGECFEYFADGQFQGDVRTLEISERRVRIVYEPVPGEG
jgi:hypothetical protein